jgi:hypothetical protein
VRCLGRATARDDDGGTTAARCCETHGQEEKKKNRGSARPTAGKTRKEKTNRGSTRPTAGKTRKKKKTISDPRPARWRDPFLHLSSFFFLFSFFLVENLVLLGVEFFCAFFSH